jgi:hypothetical protein
MKRSLTRTATALGLAAALLAVTPAISDAGVTMVNVSGTAQCDTAGPVGRYQLNWTVNNTLSSAITITSAEQGPPINEPVTLNPTNVAAGGTATGSDGPFPGDTTGTVTLTVTYNIAGGPSGQTATGSVTLAGNCVIPSTTSSSTSSSSTTSSTVAPTTTVRSAVTATPRFTG